MAAPTLSEELKLLIGAHIAPMTGGYDIDNLVDAIIPLLERHPPAEVARPKPALGEYPDEVEAIAFQAARRIYEEPIQSYTDEIAKAIMQGRTSCSEALRGLIEAAEGVDYAPDPRGDHAKSRRTLFAALDIARKAVARPSGAHIADPGKMVGVRQ